MRRPTRRLPKPGDLGQRVREHHLAAAVHPQLVGTRFPAVGRAYARGRPAALWAMLAHSHGQIWSARALARALGIGESAIRRHLDLMRDAFLVRQLPPWHANLGKRQVKPPTIPVRDRGLLHQLLGIAAEKPLPSHPRPGASWEGVVVEQVLATEPLDEVCFWATRHGAGIDLILRRGGDLFGVECTRVEAARMPPSIGIASTGLGLKRVAIGRRLMSGPGNRHFTSRVRSRPRPCAPGA